MSPGGSDGRTILVWCPDWPVMAAEIVEGVSASGAVVVLHGNRVVACSETARLDGVRRGMRRREAQSRCPQLVVVEHDPARDARAFEPVVAAVEEVAVGVEVLRPGACALAARGPARYFGGEEAAAERIVEQIAESCSVESQVGIADGVFAAGLAARAGRVIPPGETREFLAGMTIEALERPELTDLLTRLGIKTLGDFAALPAADVLTRFGFDGALAHRLASGLDHRPLAVRRPPPDLDVAETYDEPLERVDVAAFAGRVLAERLHDRLAAHGLVCTRLGIEAITADGQELHRVWRHDGTLTATAIAERVRWQLDGWLTGARRGGSSGRGSGCGGSSGRGSGCGGPSGRGSGCGGSSGRGSGCGGPARPTAGLVRLRLIPDGVLVHLGLQPGLWGDAGAERERAHRAFSRVQGLLGPEAVVTPVVGGGRSADDQVRVVPWGDERDPDRPAARHDDPIPDVVSVPVLAHTPESLAPVIPLHFRSGPGAPELPEHLAEVFRLPSREEREATRPASAQSTSGQAAPAPPRTGRLALVRPAPGPLAPTSPVPVSPAPEQPALGRPMLTPPTEPSSSAEIQPGAGQDAPGASVVVEQAAGRMPAGSSVVVEQAAGRRPARPSVVEQAAGPGPGGRGKPAKRALPPWPGRVPRPAPAVVLHRPVGAVVLDDSGAPVGVSARLELTGSPATLSVERGRPVEITGWAGPWPVDERWWAPGEARRRARFQMILADGRALLVCLTGGHWAVEAIYD